MAVSGQNPHGEADFVERFRPRSVLDAGCGTGRVAIELSTREIEAVGTDLDPQMLSVASDKAPHLTWVESDLASLDLGRSFDVVVMAGNVILFVAPGTEAAVVAGAARHVRPGGHLVAGFSITPEVTADAWDTWVAATGLEPVARHSSWHGEVFTETADYLVAVARRPTPEDLASQ